MGKLIFAFFLKLNCNTLCYTYLVYKLEFTHLWALVPSKLLSQVPDTDSIMVLIVDGNSKHVAQASREMGHFGESISDL